MGTKKRTLKFQTKIVTKKKNSKPKLYVIIPKFIIFLMYHRKNQTPKKKSLFFGNILEGKWVFI